MIYPDRFFLALISGVCLSGIVVQEVAGDTELNIAGYRVVWHDEFSGVAVDPTKWEVNEGVNAFYQRASDGRFVEPHWFGDAFEPWLQVGAINDERQYYSSANVAVVDGVLEIRADREQVLEPVGWYQEGYHEYTSGKLNTADEFQFQFGIVRWRAQLPAGPGLWPALWLLNAPDPWFWDDEIDVMEARGSLPTHMSSAHHFKVADGGGNLQNRFNTVEVDTGINLQTSFNEYTLLWEPTFLQTWVNDQQVLFDAEAIPQGPMFLIMNAAVGGAFDGLPGPDNVFPTYFKIDWVRVWQPASTPSDLSRGGFEEYQGSQWPDWNTVDSGNIAPYTAAPLHGAASVEIGPMERTVSEPELPTNWFVDGTASGWRGYLNLLNAEGDVVDGGEQPPELLAQSFEDDSVVLPVYAGAASPRANAVVFKQLAGGLVSGRRVLFSGNATVQEPFAAGASAKAFIRIFNEDFSLTDVAADMTAGGLFRLEADIPGSGVPFVQVGIETTGDVGAAGRLLVTQLFVQPVQTLLEWPPDGEPATGLHQTVHVQPGQQLRYGLMAANHPEHPLSDGVEGRMTLQFLNADNIVISQDATTVLNSGDFSAGRLFSMQTTTPTGTASVRLRIERVAPEDTLDDSGRMLVDAAFMHVSGATELPEFVTVPSADRSVNAGDPVLFSVAANSPTPVNYTWYHNGLAIGSAKDLQLQTHPQSGGAYVVVATNAAGPVISEAFQLTVLDPDSDGDGYSDYVEENLLQTDPNDPDSNLRVHSLVKDQQHIELRFNAVVGVRYQLQSSTDLSEWLDMGEPLTAASTDGLLLGSGLPTTAGARFYRVAVLP